MRPVLTHDEKIEKEPLNVDLNSDSDSDNDSNYVPNPEEESEHSADEESVTSDDDECHIQSPKTPSETSSMSLTMKRKALDNDNDGSAKKSKTEEAERRARVDAIWAEMNQKDNHRDQRRPSSLGEKEKQPLDDISSSLNQTIVHSSPSAADPENKKSPSNKAAMPTPKKNKRIVRPKSTLTALVSQYNIKVPKMNTLDKSRADWQGFVDREGIQDDLKYKNKDGYMEKVAFLNRVDERRLTHLKSGRNSSKK
ncbi:bucentaur or craniofacial development-domain-containing protein [Dichotomocladium elegans]|nr:bucentaur or craniofacial development-domain-containing protein [Dichotomocladium elegans]